jgi:hypothetical protein
VFEAGAHERDEMGALTARQRYASLRAHDAGEAVAHIHRTGPARPGRVPAATGVAGVGEARHGAEVGARFARWICA